MTHILPILKWAHSQEMTCIGIQKLLVITRLYGQDARDAFFAKIQSEETFDLEVYGSEAPINSSVFRKNRRILS